MHSKNALYINGQWVAPHGSSVIHVVNPYTEATIGQVPAASADDVNRAVDAAKNAFAAWSTTTATERSTYLKRVAQGLKEHFNDLASLITSEVGMPLKLAGKIQVGSPIALFSLYADLLNDFSFEHKVGNSLVMREPIGVVGCITPWNYPLHQIAAKVAAALAAGCTVVLKPSEITPLNAFILAQVIHDAGLPAGVFNLVSGYGHDAGQALATHPYVDMVSFTGSTNTGRHLSALAAQHIKRVSLELGGKSASLVLEDADLQTAVKGTVSACYLNSGQTCSALTRLLVPEHLYDDAVAAAIACADRFTLGDPLDQNTKLGPLVSAKQRDRVLEYINKGIQQGAMLVHGGPQAFGLPATGYFVAPTILGKVQPENIVAQEEIFGPVLSISTYKDQASGIALANNSIYGLSGAVWSGDESRAIQVAKQLRTGQVEINGGGFNMLAPFGGMKQSGNGRELGVYGLEEFLEYKSLQLPANRL